MRLKIEYGTGSTTRNCSELLFGSLTYYIFSLNPHSSLIQRLIRPPVLDHAVINFHGVRVPDDAHYRLYLQGRVRHFQTQDPHKHGLLSYAYAAVVRYSLCLRLARLSTDSGH